MFFQLCSVFGKETEVTVLCKKLGAAFGLIDPKSNGGAIVTQF